MTRKQKLVLIWFLAGLWTIVIFAPALIPGFKPPPEINAGFPTVIGALLVVPTKEENRKGQREEVETTNATGEIDAGD